MAEESSDRKKISELYFGYSEALKGLEAIENELEKLNKTSKTAFDNVQKGMEKSFSVGIDYSKIVNTEAVKKSLDKITEISESQAKRLTTTINNEAIKTTGVKQREAAKQETIEKNALTKSLLKEQELANFKEKQAIKEEARNKRIADSTQTMYGKIASYAKTYLIYQGFNILKRETKELVNEMVNVEYQMVQIDRVLNDSSLDINKYRDQLIKLAYDYGNSFENVADITLRLAQAGFDAQQSLALTEKTLLALNTAELNATQATSDMVAIMSQWNLMTGNATKVSEDYAAIIDKINKVADNFPTTSADILNALKKTSSAFNLAGASIDETIAMIVTAEVASQRGGKAIGTAMNNIIQQLKDTGRMATMEALGLDIYTDSAKTEFKSIIEIITQLSEKMQELKAAGKENSVEMQQLLSVFTLFRRNVGAGLLTGVAGEDSTYMQVLETSMDSLGYSLQENEKHLKTAKAAQEQFNATLLELKTKVWDAGGEDVFRGLLVLGTDVVNIFKVLIDTFGTLPTTMGLVTLAFSAFNKELQIAKINEKGTGIELAGFLSKLKGAEVQVKSTTGALEGAKAATIGLKIETIALNAVWSLGLSLAITTVLSLLNNWIHAAENARKEQEEIISNSNEIINKNKQEAETIEKLIADYEKYSNIEGILTEEESKGLENSQKAVSEYLIQNNKYTKEMVGNYGLQLQVLKQITEEHRKQNIERAKQALQVSRDKQTGIDTNIFYDFTGKNLSNLQKAGINTGEYLGEYYQSLRKLSDLDFNTQLEALTKWKEQLETTGKVGTEAYKWIISTLDELQNQSNDTDEALKKLNNEILTQKFDDFLSEYNIKTAEDYAKALEDISKIEPPEDYEGTLEDFQAIMQQTLENTFPNFSGGLEELNDNLGKTYDTLGSNLKQLSLLQDKYTSLTTAVNEYNESGSLTIGTFQKLVDNNLLQYLNIVNGKLQFNSDALIISANDAKAKAIADLQAEAAAEILAIAQADYNKTLKESIEPSNIAQTKIEQTGNAALISAQKALEAAGSWKEFYNALENNSDKLYYSGVSDEAKKQINNVISNFRKQATAINSISLSAAKSSSGASRSATKTFEEQSSERVKIFKKEIDDLEKLEQSWVNKYKKLELFSTSDLKFITHQRINRYNEYLNQINQLQGISEEDRTELVREYSSKRQEAELEYFDLLKQQLDDQIKAFEDANKERIQQIKDQAQAQIDALQKVEDENDRIRQKEEYLRKRDELIHGNQGIEYWQQRTGREAQIALAEAQKELEDLDRDWEEKKEEWNLDDQVEQIEKARDAQIAAIEEAQEQQIQGWKNAYEAQVQLYAQTGQIIYDDSIINAGYLYNAYMDNFVTPFHAQIQNVVNSINQASAAADNVINKMNTISGGGGSTRSVSQAVQKNTSSSVYGPSLNTPISPLLNKTVGEMTAQAKFKAATSTISLPKKLFGKFHGGGKVGSQTEAFALLRPNEVVLTPEWASGMNRLVKSINDGTFNGNNGTTNNIDIQGNLVNLEANIKNKQDADYLTERIEKILKDKFNIRK